MLSTLNHDIISQTPHCVFNVNLNTPYVHITSQNARSTHLNPIVRHQNMCDYFKNTNTHTHTQNKENINEIKKLN